MQIYCIIKKHNEIKLNFILILLFYSTTIALKERNSFYRVSVNISGNVSNILGPT